MVLVRNLILAARTSLRPPSITGHYEAQVTIKHRSACRQQLETLYGRPSLAAPFPIPYPLPSLHRPIRNPRGSGRLLFLNEVASAGRLRRPLDEELLSFGAPPGFPFADLDRLLRSRLAVQPELEFCQLAVRIEHQGLIEVLFGLLIECGLFVQGTQF